MTQSAYLFLGLTAVVAALAAVLAYAVLRIFAAARLSTRHERSAGVETAFMAAAMEDAVRKLREGERAMKARAEASERLSSEIVASLTSGLLVVDAGGIIRTLNPAGQAMLGLAHSNWQGPYRDVLRDVSPLADVLEECLRTATPVVRRSLPISIGAVSHLGLTVSPIREDGANAPAINEDGANAPAINEDGANAPAINEDANAPAVDDDNAPPPAIHSQGAHGVICLFSDLTEVMELEEQLRLKDSLARLGEMTAGIAHEFRNGLATIHGYSRLLDLERLEPKYRPYVQGIRDETESLKQVVTNFLNFARPTELILTPIDMKVLVERAADDIRPDARARGGDIVVHGEFGRVDGDEILLRQALSNLCRNAFEACDNAHVVPRISIDGERDASHGVLRISVCDNGPGIPDAVASRVFRPFFTTKANGTGLGLALVQKIIVTHNGRISVVNDDGGGARFLVTLPVAARVRNGVAVPATPA